MRADGGNLHSTDFFTNPKVLLDRWGGDLDRELVLGDALYAEDACSVQNVRCSVDSFGRRRPFFCNVPYQDIVVPPSVFERRPMADCHHCHYSGNASSISHRIPYVQEGDSFDKEMIKDRTIMLFQAGSQHFHQAECVERCVCVGMGVGVCEV
jgi:hypothetical protein